MFRIFACLAHIFDECFEFCVCTLSENANVSNFWRVGCDFERMFRTFCLICRRMKEGRSAPLLHLRRRHLMRKVCNIRSNSHITRQKFETVVNIQIMDSQNSKHSSTKSSKQAKIRNIRQNYFAKNQKFETFAKNLGGEAENSKHSQKVNFFFF